MPNALLPGPALAAFVLLNLLASCGGGSSAVDPGGTDAANSDIAFIQSRAGVTPFIAMAKFRGQSISLLSSVAFTVTPSAGATAAAAHVSYSMPWLQSAGALPGNNSLELPVFGLYAGATNTVNVELTFEDASVQTIPVSIVAAGFTDPNHVFDHLAMLQKRDASVPLGFSYMYLKTGLGTPVVIDVDGNVRWASTGLNSAFSSVFENNEFLVGDQKTPALYHVALDGSITQGESSVPDAVDFSHNIAIGRDALLAEFDTKTGGILNIESTIAEMTPTGVTVREWDVAQIIADYMTSQGDDAAAFVRPGENWLHLNGSLYDPSDDTLIVSSRENFVMKVGYTTQDIRWILGDTTKYWYTFPSLRAKAVVVTGADQLPPAGQHALSFTNEGDLMVFNDLTQSFDQPVGKPVGINRPYSIVSAYAIDTATMTAQEVWRYDHGDTLKTPLCGSAYEAHDDSLLVDYAQTDDATHTRLLGIAADHASVAFDYQYPNPSGCATAWNAQIFPLDQLIVD